MEGLDLDAADPRRCRAELAELAELEVDRLSENEHLAYAATDARSNARSNARSDAGAVEDRSAARAAAIALVAQAYAARLTETAYGPRPVAPTTANLRLAALSSFYTYGIRQDLLRGPNPIARVERRSVEAHAAARPLAYEDLRAHLAAIDVTTTAGLRDYALLLVALYTGRRVAELAGMRREHLRIRARAIEIVWPRCKGGKAMRDELPRGGARGAAADALVAWLIRLDGEHAEHGGAHGVKHDKHGGRADGHPGHPDHSSQLGEALGAPVSPVGPPPTVGAVLPFPAAPPAMSPRRPGRTAERPLWVSLARNGTAGHPLTARAIAQLCEKRLGTGKVHTLRHTFARALEDAGAKVSEIQAALGHADLGTTGRYLARLHQGENRHLGRLSGLYGLRGHDPTEQE
jgi:integrase